MKQILSEEEFEIPKGVEIDFKARQVQVKGPRGILKRNFRHLGFDLKKHTDDKKRNKIKLQIWFAKKKQASGITSVSSQIKNMIKGVTYGYRYKMRFAYAHFPINATVTNGGNTLEIRNFLGEKIIRKIDMLPGTTVSKKEDVKDELTIEGNDLNNVSLSCALIHQSTLVKNKDIRKFLDGIYVYEKGTIEQAKED